MSFLDVVILAVVQGLAELLPVSSSAHVVVAEKLLGLDPSSPPMTLLLVMLHTGTMFAVIVYFWRQWRGAYFSSVAAFKAIAGRLVLATAITAIVGEILVKLVEKTALRG
jgi:undecaprenyl-diphosphatase